GPALSRARPGVGPQGPARLRRGLSRSRAPGRALTSSRVRTLRFLTISTRECPGSAESRERHAPRCHRCRCRGCRGPWPCPCPADRELTSRVHRSRLGPHLGLIRNGVLQRGTNRRPRGRVIPFLVVWFWPSHDIAAPSACSLGGTAAPRSPMDTSLLDRARL